jgi:hypothetical protein
MADGVKGWRGGGQGFAATLGYMWMHKGQGLWLCREWDVA